MRFLPTLGVCAILATSLMANSCDGQSEGMRRESRATDQLIDQASIAAGIPAIRNFTEKRQLKMLYELRDNAKLTTHSYWVDLNGNLHKVCPTTSVGYGMPFSAQYTAPERPARPEHRDSVRIYQPEPNGLYMPDSTSATWVICLGDDGELKPVYVEPQIIVSLTPMESD